MILRKIILICILMALAAGPVAAAGDGQVPNAANRHLAQIIIADFRAAARGSSLSKNRDLWVKLMMLFTTIVYSESVQLTDEDRGEMKAVFEHEFSLFEDRMFEQQANYLAGRFSVEELEAIAFLIKGVEPPFERPGLREAIQGETEGIEEEMAAVGRREGGRLGIEAGQAAHDRIKAYLEGKYGDLGIEGNPFPAPLPLPN